jgi:peptidyl-prolyl cis-trans isomerase C
MKHTLIRTVSEAAPQEGFSGCGHGPAPAARREKGAPPIYVDGVLIAEGAIAAEAQNHSAGSAAEARAAAARALVIRHLLLRRAEAMKLEPDAERDEDGREETREEALIRQVLQREAPGDEPTEAECRRVYETSISKFAAPEIFEASHILFEPGAPGDEAWVDAHKRACSAIAELLAGADFAACARAYSACSSAAEGGALGQFVRGDLAPSIEDTLAGLTPGSLGPAPIRTRHGWHVVRLDRHAPARTLPFEAVEEHIRAALHARSAVAASARYVERLAADAEIEGLSLSGGAAS